MNYQIKILYFILFQYVNTVRNPLLVHIAGRIRKKKQRRLLNKRKRKPPFLWIENTYIYIYIYISFNSFCLKKKHTRTFFLKVHQLNLEQQGRSSTTEGYIYRHRLITRSTTTIPSTTYNSYYYQPSATSFLNYYQPPPTFTNEYITTNQTDNLCPRQKNVHRNCQRSCHGINQNTNCRHNRICVCDHNCGFSCLSRSNNNFIFILLIRKINL